MKLHKYEFKNPAGVVVYSTIQVGKMKYLEQRSLVKLFSEKYKTKIQVYESDNI
jgi:hypothetical protein